MLESGAWVLLPKSHIQQCCILPQVSESGFTVWQNAYFQSNTRTVEILALKKSLICCLCLLKYTVVFWIADKRVFYLHIWTHSSLSNIFVYLEHAMFVMSKLDLKFHWNFYIWCYPHRITVIHCLELSKINMLWFRMFSNLTVKKLQCLKGYGQVTVHSSFKILFL